MLRGVDLEVERGEFVAIVGASGLGQEHAAAPARPARRARRGRRPARRPRIDNLPDRKRDGLRNRTFGFIFQFYHLLPELSALENVMMPQMIRDGLSGRSAAEASADPPRGDGAAGARRPRPPADPPAQGALRRRDAARARSRGPWPAGPRSCWPTSRPATSTPRSGQAVMELLRDLNRERGLTMIMVTHDLNIAQQADRIVRLAEGGSRSGRRPGLNGPKCGARAAGSAAAGSRRVGFASRRRSPGEGPHR